MAGAPWGPAVADSTAASGTAGRPHGGSGAARGVASGTPCDDSSSRPPVVGLSVLLLRNDSEVLLPAAGAHTRAWRGSCWSFLLSCPPRVAVRAPAAATSTHPPVHTAARPAGACQAGAATHPWMYPSSDVWGLSQLRPGRRRQARRVRGGRLRVCVRHRPMRVSRRCVRGCPAPATDGRGLSADTNLRKPDRTRQRPCGRCHYCCCAGETWGFDPWTWPSACHHGTTQPCCVFNKPNRPVNQAPAVRSAPVVGRSPPGWRRSAATTHRFHSHWR
jgi:hypothetical protein